MNARLFRLIGAIAVATLLLIPGQSVFAQRIANPSVTPTDGVPGVRFTFRAPGFLGATPIEDAKDNMGEEIAYWINLPNGTIISTREIDDAQRALKARANGYGEVTIVWSAPGDAIPGPYSLVMHGLQSDKEVAIPFGVHADGWQTVLQTDVTPRVGPAGSTFRFVATGFDKPADKDSQYGEQVAYWFNTPDGKVISSEKRSGKTDYGNETKPLLHLADKHGTVNLVWDSPADLKPGLYSIVLHGLDSHHEVLMYFTIK
jgi:hypothetical protein